MSTLARVRHLYGFFSVRTRKRIDVGLNRLKASGIIIITNSTSGTNAITRVLCTVIIRIIIGRRRVYTTRVTPVRRLIGRSEHFVVVFLTGLFDGGETFLRTYRGITVVIKPETNTVRRIERIVSARAALCCKKKNIENGADRRVFVAIFENDRPFPPSRAAWGNIIKLVV